MKGERKGPSPGRLLFFTLFFLYLLLSSGKFDIVDGYFRYLLAREISMKGSVALFEDEISTFGEFTLKGEDGEYYSYFGLGQSLIMAIPVLITGGGGGLIFMISPLFSALSAVLFFKILLSLRFGERLSTLLALLSGTGTTLLPYAKSTFDTALYTFFLLMAIHSLLKGRGGRYLYLLAGGLSAGFVLNLNPSGVFLLPPLLYLMIHPESGMKLFAKEHLKRAGRDIPIFLAGYIPLLLLFFWYNQLRFGSILETGHTVHYPLKEHVSNPILIGLAGLLLSPGKGLFLYSPILLLSFFRLPRFFREARGMAIASALLFLPFLILHSSLPFWHGDWCWGPRYLVPLIPVLLIPSAFYIEEISKGKGRGIFAKVVIPLSILIQLAGASLNHDIYFRERRLEPYFHMRTLRPYFDPSMSPMKDRFLHLLKIGHRMSRYRYIPPAQILKMEGDLDENLLRHLMEYNNPDFWWVYSVVSNRHPEGSLIMAGFIFVNLLVSLRLLARFLREGEE